MEDVELRDIFCIIRRKFRLLGERKDVWTRLGSALAYEKEVSADGEMRNVNST